MLGYYIQTSVVGLMILAIILFNLGKIKGERKFNDRVFAVLVVSNGLLLILEALLNVFNTYIADQANLPLLIIVLLFYILNPLPCLLWTIFVVSWINRDRQIDKRFIAVILLPILLNALLSVSSLATGYSFYLDELGTYHRGPGYIYLVIIDLLYLGLAAAIVMKNRGNIRRQEVFALNFFPVPPLLAGLIQTMFFGISVLWLAMAISLLIIYLDLQSTNVHVDHLTGLANRRKLDNFLNEISTKKHVYQRFGGLMMDIDQFKQINDQYGHEMGDRVLESVGKILRRSMDPKSLITRYGGDEFIVLLKIEQPEDLAAAKHRFLDNLAAFNNHHSIPFEISLSIGTGVFDPQKNMDVHEFLGLLDRNMYLEKKQCHQSRG